MIVPRVAGYSQVAEEYFSWVTHGDSIHSIVLPLVLDLLGSLEGQEICDLACGPGIASLELARRGASVVGVDISAEMLTIAERETTKHPELTIRYLQDDAETLKRLANASFDGVVCNMALTDVEDLGAMALAVSRVLRPGGRFVFSMPHPCFQAPGSTWHHDAKGVAALVRGYFREGPWFSDIQISGRYGGHHRTLSTIANTLTKSGLHYARAEEPQAVIDSKPGYGEVPVAYIACYRVAGEVRTW